MDFTKDCRKAHPDSVQDLTFQAFYIFIGFFKCITVDHLQSLKEVTYNLNK